MPSLRNDTLSPDTLLFDPNNYRFQDKDEYVQAAEERFFERTVQERAYHRLKDEGIQDLKRSILQNGFIPVEHLVVRPYRFSDDQRYVVIEGNRRLAAVKWILDDYSAGVVIDESTLASLQNLPVVVIEEEEDDETFRASLMGIRHVSGIKQWGGYQRAKLIVDMRDSLELETGEVSERLGLSSHEVNRRYRAYKSLQQMKDNEEFGGYASVKLYPLFHEAVSLPAIRDWLEWDEDQSIFMNEEKLHKFYSLITPSTNEETEELEPKITTYLQIRELRNILPNPEAKRVLLDSHSPFHEAVSIAKREEQSRLWVQAVSDAIVSLQNIEIQALKNLSNSDLSILTELKNLVEERLNDYHRLVN
jgi:hypothetical protein